MGNVHEFPRHLGTGDQLKNRNLLHDVVMIFTLFFK